MGVKRSKNVLNCDFYTISGNAKPISKVIVEIDGERSCSSRGSILCQCHYYLGFAGTKNVLNCDFCDTEGARILNVA